MAQSFASSEEAASPVSRIKARACVRSRAFTNSSPTRRWIRSSTAGAEPAAASSSHSPGPDPTTSEPSGSRWARPNRTPSAAARFPSESARTPTFARGVRSEIRRVLCARAPETSHPATVSIGWGVARRRAVVGVGAAALIIAGLEILHQIHEPQALRDLSPLASEVSSRRDPSEVFALAPERDQLTNVKLAILAIDGLSWEVLVPLLDRGDLRKRS